MSQYTIIGGQGFLGSELASQLEKYSPVVPPKNDESIFNKNLGTVFYCAGHGDCNNNPFKVYDSNLNYLSKLLQNADFEKLVYVSSTRVYMDQNSSQETGDICVLKNDPRRLFNLTKLTAEELCLKSQKSVVIVRPSNIYGGAINSPLFLPSIVRDAVNKKQVNMYISPEYNKDYVSVKDVAHCMIELAKKPSLEQPIVNIASGKNVSAQSIADILQSNTQCEVIWHPTHQKDDQFPVTDISYLKSLIDFKPRSVELDLKEMIKQFTQSQTLVE